MYLHEGMCALAGGMFSEQHVIPYRRVGRSIAHRQMLRPDAKLQAAAEILRLSRNAKM